MPDQPHPPHRPVEDNSSENTEDKEQSFISHLIELRQRLLHGVVCVLIVFLSLFYFANDLYEILADPLMRHLPENATMIATQVASPFLAPFKLTLIVSVFVSMPYLLYQAWAFVAPGLYQHEQQLVMPLLITSSFLFYAGIAFAYFAVFPIVFAFFTSAAPEGVTVMTDITHYLDFVFKLFFGFGLAFEVPIATILFIRTGIISKDDLAAKRPYVIVIAFIVGMLLTPPDVVSQILLAIPVWLLFELGLIMSGFLPTRKEPSVDETLQS